MNQRTKAYLDAIPSLREILTECGGIVPEDGLSVRVRTLSALATEALEAMLQCGELSSTLRAALCMEGITELVLTECVDPDYLLTGSRALIRRENGAVVAAASDTGKGSDLFMLRDWYAVLGFYSCDTIYLWIWHGGSIGIQSSTEKEE